MTATQVRLCESLKRLGFTKGYQIKIYGLQFDLVGDPHVVSDNLVFVDAVEQKSLQLKRVRIPLNIIKMAAQHAKETPAA